MIGSQLYIKHSSTIMEGPRVMVPLASNLEVEIPIRSYFTVVTGFQTKHIDIYLGTTILYLDEYLEVFILINQATRLDVITVHLSGDGGSADSLYAFANLLLETPARVVTKIYGSVYSAHALMNFIADEIHIPEYGLMMLHRTSMYGQEAQCVEDTTATDRTQPVREKCLDSIHTYTAIGDDFIIKNILPILGKKLVFAILSGKDVYIMFPDLVEQYGTTIKAAEIVAAYWETHDYEKIKKSMLKKVLKDRLHREST